MRSKVSILFAFTIILLLSLPGCANLDNSPVSANSAETGVSDSVQKEGEDYSAAYDLLLAGQYEAAAEAFALLGDYSNSEEKMNEALFLQAEESLDNEEYSLAESIYEKVSGKYEDEANKRIRAIQCQSAAKTVMREYDSKNPENMPVLYDTMALYGAAAKTGTEYDVKEYTFHFTYYFPELFDSFAGIFSGSGTGDFVKQVGGVDASKLPYGKEAYLRFKELGYDDITCVTHVYNFDGTEELCTPAKYTKETYEKEIRELEEADKAAGIDRQGDFVIKDGVLIEYTGDSSTIVVPNGVTAIGYRAFYKKNIVSITMPNTVLEIKEDAFSGCEQLKTISFSTALQTIGSCAFGSCYALKTVNLPNTISFIDSTAFYGDSIKKFTFASGIARITDDIRICGEEIVIPEGCEAIAASAIGEYTYNMILHLPATLSRIEPITYYGYNTTGWIGSEVYYSGTVAQWNSIDSISAVEPNIIHCSDAEYKRGSGSDGNSWINSSGSESPSLIPPAIAVGTDYIYPSDSQYISFEELDRFSKEEIMLLRNEIYARYGYTFQSIELRDYFMSKTWYHPDENVNANTFGTSNMNDFERTNIDTILDYERSKGWRQ